MIDPVVPVDVRLHPALHAVLGSVPGGLGASCERVGSAVAKAVTRFGVPARCVVRLGVADSPDRPVVVTVAGRPCRYPRGLDAPTRLFHGAVGRALPEPSTDLLSLAAEVDTDGAIALLATVVADQVARRAHLLLNSDVLDAWARGTRLAADPDLRASLELSLRLGLPIGDRACVGATLDGTRGQASLARTEAVADWLAEDGWRLMIHPEYLSVLLESATADDLQTFPELRRAVVDRLGVPLPRLTIAEDATLPEQGFALNCGGYMTPPFIGLLPETEPTTDVPHDALDGEEESLRFQRPMGLIARTLLVLASGVARTGMITLRVMGDELDRLERSWPRVARAARPFTADLTRLRRELARESVSVRNTVVLAQTVLDEKARTGRVPDPDEMLRRFRRAQRSMVCAAAAPDTPGLTAWRLPDGADQTAFLARVLSEENRGKVVVVPAAARPAVRALAVDEFPSLPILVDDELEPDVPIEWRS